MEVIYQLKASELTYELVDRIKKLFGQQEINITITAEPDETAYLTMNPANEKHLLESLAEEPQVRLTPEEFKKKINEL